MRWSITVIPVHAQGRALTDSAKRVLQALGYEFEASEVDIGPARFRATGDVLPEKEFGQLKASDAIFVGAPPVGGLDLPRGLLERGIVFRLRQELDLYVNLRPFVGHGADVAVVRENTEGAYIGEGGVLRGGGPDAVATQGSITTAFGVDRCIRYALSLARTRRRRLTLVHKVNVLTFAGSIWLDALARARNDYTDVECDYADIDTACVRLIQDAGQFDVIVTDNLFGDVISDVAGAACDALARSGSADLNPDPAAASLFEPLHAVAGCLSRTPPERVDPRGAHAAVALFLRHKGEVLAADALDAAIREVGDSHISTAAAERAVLAAYSRYRDSLA